jgi:hypothetical protein
MSISSHVGASKTVACTSPALCISVANSQARVWYGGINCAGDVPVGVLIGFTQMIAIAIQFHSRSNQLFKSASGKMFPPLRYEQVNPSPRT